MYDLVLISRDLKQISWEQLVRAVNIYISKPHVVNRKLFGVSTLCTFAYRRKQDGNTLSDVSVLVEQFTGRYSLGWSPSDVIVDLEEKFCLEFEELPQGFDLNGEQESGKGCLILNRLLPRNLKVFKPLEVLAVVDNDSQNIFFVCLQDEENNLTPKFPFSIQLVDTNLSINCNSVPAPDEKSAVWLKDVLFHRLLKWIDNIVQASSKPSSSDEQLSLSLITDLEQYNHLYGTLKAKYGTEMVKIWPETTDPRKFVYEDVAIATYLILLWKQEREEIGSDRLQSFVDIGCGNGLLVYILASEGHDGVGIDLRKRRIWDFYPECVQLREEPIVPSDAALFPTTDWIIGNHSDELSPWIPVLAARSSFRCRYFLLPCCAFEFDGSKFQRQNSAVSQYGDFLRYAREISEVCGFETTVDRLKIPSTKRTCLIGADRIYREEAFGEYSERIQRFIESRIGPSKTESGKWSEGFEPRASEERVRNCTKIERSIIDEIVRTVFEALIAKKRIADDFPGKNWNAGGTIAIGELVKIISQDRLNRLKSECGGLQTLLKNNHQIFHVLNGCVQLRIPTKIGLSSKTAEELRRKVKKQKNTRIVNLKERPCWFFSNHPDGCPFDEVDCKFKH